MRLNRNFLASIFNFLGDALEEFNPSAFRFLSAVLPYLTPVPVAWLTADSAATFLHFTRTISFIFVFALEGIGLWFTSLLVDAVVDWVRSRNRGSFVPVIMFTLAVGSYVFLLVSLNVTLESARGDSNAELSKVITLMCFLPLITGIGNGYYKLKLERKTELQHTKLHDEELELRRLSEQRQMELARLDASGKLELAKLQERNKTRLELLKLQQETSRSTNGSSISTSESNRTYESTSGSTNGTSKMGRPSVHEERVFSYLDSAYSGSGVVPPFSAIVRDLEVPESTASRLRNKWLSVHPEVR